MAKKPKERQRYIVRLENGERHEVSREVYLCIWTSERQEQYQRERDAANGVVSYEAWMESEEGNQRGDYLVDTTADVWNQVVRKLENAQLHMAIDQLTPKEKHLIYLLFFKEKSLTEAAAEMGVSRQAAQQRKARIFKKLRKLLRPDFE